jgi:hypothetical protein
MTRARHWILCLLGVAMTATIAYGCCAPTKEGFQSVVNCVDQGYPQDFCMHVPAQAVIDSGYCNCVNGELGTRTQPGLCSCFPFNLTFPYYPSPVFDDWLR